MSDKDKEKDKRKLPTTVTQKDLPLDGKALSERQEKLLKKLYFDDGMMFGRDRLWHYLTENYPDYEISRRSVNDWLKKQEVGQLYQSKKKTKTIKSNIVSAPYKQVSIDLKDMGVRAYKEWHWILTGLDVFSKRGFAVPLKDKEAPTVLKGFKTMLGEMKKKPGSILSDRGSEFTDTSFVAFLKEQGIKQVLTKPNSPQGNPVERFNGTLGRMLQMWSDQKDDQDWVSILPKLVDNYNKTVSRTTGKTPYQVEDEDDEGQKKTKENIRKAVLPKNENINEVKFKKGDRVRIKLNKDDTFQKSRRNWSDEIYRIHGVFKNKKDTVYTPQYELMTDDGEDIQGRFYNEDLQLVGRVEHKMKAPEKYKIRRIERPVMKRNGRVYTPSYEVSWIGYTEKTIEPRDNLLRDIPKKVEKFDKDHQVKWSKTKVTWKK